MKTEFSFTAVVRLTLEHYKGEPKSRHKATDFYLDLSKNLDTNKYLDSNDLPNKEGSHVLTATLVSGLAANIHLAHEKGFRDSAEHLRYIIAQLESEFTTVPMIRSENIKPEVKNNIYRFTWISHSINQECHIQAIDEDSAISIFKQNVGDMNAHCQNLSDIYLPKYLEKLLINFKQTIS